MAIILLSLGTNVGDRNRNISRALARLQTAVGVELISISAVYETAPWGPIQDQPWFFNLCLSAFCDLQPKDLLALLKQIEAEIGREKATRWGPRLIDIDLLFYDDLILHDERLHVPHARIAERAFVLCPLVEIAAEFVHPEEGRTIAELREKVDITDVNRLPNIAFPIPRLFSWGARTYMMGILNATPDSFSGDGLLAHQDGVQAAVEQALAFVAAGADILDIGGESTRPGFQPLNADEELDRVIPVITAVRAAMPTIPISVDTYRATVAEAALSVGADWVNDIWGLQYDPDMSRVVATANCPVVLMHNGRNRERIELHGEPLHKYDDLVGEVVLELQNIADGVVAAGVMPENIILDPGLGFGKTPPQSLELISRLNEIADLPYPLLLGSSRKGFVGRYSGQLPRDERIEGTAATVTVGIDRGADIVRVHDIKQIGRVIRMTDALVRRPNANNL